MIKLCLLHQSNLCLAQIYHLSKLVTLLFAFINRLQITYYTLKFTNQCIDWLMFLRFKPVIKRIDLWVQFINQCIDWLLFLRFKPVIKRIDSHSIFIHQYSQCFLSQFIKLWYNLFFHCYCIRLYRLVVSLLVVWLSLQTIHQRNNNYFKNYYTLKKYWN